MFRLMRSEPLRLKYMYALVTLLIVRLQPLPTVIDTHHHCLFNKRPVIFAQAPGTVEP